MDTDFAFFVERHANFSLSGVVSPKRAFQSESVLQRLAGGKNFTFHHDMWTDASPMSVETKSIRSACSLAPGHDYLTQLLEVS
jgi:hypothetical protein